MREIVAEKRLLLFPVKNDAPKRSVRVEVNGKLERFFEIELADAEPDWWVPLDISAWKGATLSLQVENAAKGSPGLDKVRQADQRLNPGDYHSGVRPQFHFTPESGWNNDPNGMVFSEGEYHLYFQYNPYGRNWGNMHWGHAVSPDLVHWEELPIALYPHAPGDAVFSGSAVVDTENTSGWKAGADALLVSAYTSTGRGECIAYSNDRGRSWKEFEGNPVVKHNGRDPRLLWYEPAKEWVMAVYDEDKQQPKPEDQRAISFYTSPDLKRWTFQSRIPGFFECPDFFELPVDGNTANRKWILTAANSDYEVGTFDGKTFTAETPKLKGNRGRGFYAAQTFSNEPKGRRIQIGWFQIATHGKNWNQTTNLSQAMTIPLELSLHFTPEGPRLAWNSVEELAALRVKTYVLGALTLQPEAPNPAAGVTGELLEIRAEFSPSPAGTLEFNVHGVPVSYEIKTQELVVGDHRASAPLRDGKQRLTIYADRNGFEVFASDGFTYVPVPVVQSPEKPALVVSARGGPVEISALHAYELKSIWK